MKRSLQSTVFLLLFVLALLVAPLILPEFHVTLLNYIGLYAIVALGLVMLTGVGGLTSFGQAAFAGLGAYTSAYLTTVHGVSPWLTLPAGLLVTALVALSLGLVTLRLSGHFLPLGTIAWGMSLYYLFGNLEALGGHTGISSIPPLQIADLEIRSGREFFYLIWAVLLLLVLATRNLLDSREGRAIRALKGGSVMAEAMGVNTARAKILVFTVAALYAGTSGWLYAHLQRFVNPTPFSLTQGIEYLFMAVVGGVSHVWGAILGAALITVLKQWLQDWLPKLLGQSGNFEMIVFGLLMIVVLQRARDGVWPMLQRFFPQRPRRSPVEAGAALARRPLPSADAVLLEVQDASKHFGGLIANDRVSFTVRAGEVMALIGPNGAGKSTMFNGISGVDPLTSGSVQLSRRTRRVAARARHRPARHEPDLPACPPAALDERHRERRHRRPSARPPGFRRRRLPRRPGRGGAPAAGSRPADRTLRPRRADVRSGRQPAARQAAHRRDCPGARRRPLPAAPRRAGGRPALPRKTGARRPASPLARRRHRHPAGRARHGFRHGTRRPRAGHGVRPQARGRSAGRGAAQSGGGRSLPRRCRMSGLTAAGERPLVLEVSGLSVSYGKVEALHGLALKVHRGEIVTVIGPNGAGKTTLLSALIGLLPIQGEVVYLGERQRAGRSVEQLVRQGMTLVPEKRELFAEMSVEDNLLLGAFDRYRAGHRDRLETMDEVFDLFPRLLERRQQFAGTLSGGERQMLAMGRALMAKPRLLLLDEPSLGLAPLVIKEIFRTVAQLKKTGVAILLVEQNARAALPLPPSRARATRTCSTAS
jgi:ABC-type branched-subunit amino acid transport system ATPase component/ABC-type branched-subunit amino acid transport system permease subunit